jgi:hypothetical protein
METCALVKPRKRPRLPGDPIDPSPSLTQRWVTWRAGLMFGLGVAASKAIEIGVERLLAYL